MSDAVPVQSASGASDGASRLIDRWMPDYGANEVHGIRVSAPAAIAYAAVRETDLAGSPIVKVLFFLRAVPDLLRAKQSLAETRRRARAAVTLDSLEDAGFRILEERAPDEIVLGLEGRFWTPTGGVRHQDVAAFREPVPADVVRATWNFSVSPAGPGASVVSTETRIGWTDGDAGRSFMRYWRFVAPWSGLIRMRMLRSIRRHAEAAHGARRTGAT